MSMMVYCVNTVFSCKGLVSLLAILFIAKILLGLQKKHD